MISKTTSTIIKTKTLGKTNFSFFLTIVYCKYMSKLYISSKIHQTPFYRLIHQNNQDYLKKI